MDELQPTRVIAAREWDRIRNEGNAVSQATLLKSYVTPGWYWVLGYWVLGAGYPVPAAWSRTPCSQYIHIVHGRAIAL